MARQRLPSDNHFRQPDVACVFPSPARYGEIDSSVMVRGILFDFDGTLVDASHAIERTLNTVLEKCEREMWPRTRVLAGIGRPLADLFREVISDSNELELRRMLEMYEEFARLEDPASIRLKSGVRETLATLGSTTRMSIVTSRRAPGARRILERFGLVDHFSTIVGIEDVECPKPHPEPVFLALERMGISPEDALMVGDTPDDVRSARAAGVRSAAVTTGHHGSRELIAACPDHLIAELSELADLLAMNGKNPDN